MAQFFAGYMLYAHLWCIFHLCIKNFAEVNRNTENFSNFVLGSHSDYQFFRHLYFIELTLNYLLYI